MTSRPRYVQLVRDRICAAAFEYAKRPGSNAYFSSGAALPVTLFYEGQNGRHGNFLPESYEAIIANVAWRTRLGKQHQQHARLRPPGGPYQTARELDSCTSSDALLMNVFCHPGWLQSPTVRQALRLEQTAPLTAAFGVRSNLPMTSGGADAGEFDCCIGDLIIEAKLTEAGFPSAEPRFVHGYRDLGSAFRVGELPMESGGKFKHYQLIRNVLGAYHFSARFLLVYDAQRPDLQTALQEVLEAVAPRGLRQRCRSITWQQLAACAPQSLQAFLGEKYGIHP